jgi:predicted nucleotidyltransferase
MQKFLDQLIKKFENIFNDDLLCVLMLGSVIRNDHTPFSDIDLVVIIKKFDLDKFIKVRKFIRLSNKLFDISFICWNEIPKDPNLFKIGTHGCYQIGLILNKVQCLFGRNILLDLVSLLKRI